jgi:hypothetical protein
MELGGRIAHSVQLSEVLAHFTVFVRKMEEEREKVLLQEDSAVSMANAVLREYDKKEKQ